ncbi:MAG: NifB/NifX family molybdenum-iron cluster-binding protein [Candidatus Hydrogenedentota bacterium]
MKIAITATQPNLDASIDPRFGRCPYLIEANPETLDYEALENPYAFKGGGAGVKLAQTVADRGIEHVLTGECGPNAQRALTAAGIDVITGCSGSVRDAIAWFQGSDRQTGGHETPDSTKAREEPGAGAGAEAGRGPRSRGQGRGCGAKWGQRGGDKRGSRHQRRRKRRHQCERDEDFGVSKSDWRLRRQGRAREQRKTVREDANRQ